MSFSSLSKRIFFGISDWKRDRKLKIPASVRVQKDLSYGPWGKWNLLDLVTPRDAREKLPVIVSIHGGGFVYGTKEVYQFYAANLAENGFAVINFNYRLAPESRFPAQLEDIDRVMDWLAAHAAAYSLDLDRVFLVGDSAGAQLASHYAALYTNPAFGSRFPFYTPKPFPIRAVALNCGLYQVFSDSGTPLDEIFQDYLGPDCGAGDPRLDVLAAITAEFPPAYVMTSQYDFLRELAKPMYEHLLAAGVPAVYRLYGQEGQNYMGHVFHVNQNLPEAKQCNMDQCDFFKRYMK